MVGPADTHANAPAAPAGPGHRLLALLAAAAFCVLAQLGWAAGAAQAQEKRIALVVGNSRYRDVPLNNPENDARLVASRLRSLGFDVNERLNLGVREFRRVVREFARRVQDDEAVAVLYYAGHGVQIDGRNYLLPVDINLRDEEEIKDESVDIDELYVSRLDKARSKARIVILDACRDDPFRGKTRNVRTSGGLAEMAARGTLIAFSSAPGAPAEDGPPSTNSVYSRHLANEMMVEGLEVEQMFKNVRVRVLRDTHERQVPWVNTSLTVNFSFNPGRGVGSEEQARQERIQRLEAELQQTREALASARAATEALRDRAPAARASESDSRPPGGRADATGQAEPARARNRADAQRPAAADAAAPTAASRPATEAAFGQAPGLASAARPSDLTLLEAQLERTRKALEEARSEPARVSAAEASSPQAQHAMRNTPDRSSSQDRRRAGREQPGQCAELLQSASIGDELSADKQAFLRAQCKP